MSDDLTAGSGVSDGSAAGASSDGDFYGEAAAALGLPGDIDSGAPPPETPSDLSAAPADATTGDGAEDVDVSTSRGPIPYDRHQAVLTNARNKAAQREQEFQEKLQRVAWAESVDANRAQQALGLLQSLDALSDDPHAALAFIARRLGVTSQALAAPDADAMPEADLVGDNGIAVYSATQLQKVLDWQRQRWRKDVDDTYGPLKQKAVLSDLRDMAQRQTADVLADCRQNWDDFGALEPAIKALMIADANLSLERAYIKAFSVHRKQSEAAIRQAADTDRVSQLNRKAAAADSLRPGAPRPVTPRADHDKTEREIAAEVFASLST